MKLSKDIHAVMLLLAVVFFASPSLFADEWTTDYKAALDQAQKENKQVLMDFTGSDWCVFCKKIDKEVFSKNEFKDYAKKQFILLKIDFPKSSPQAPELKAQNNELKEKFKIRGFPTVVVLDSKGDKVGEIVGYGDPNAKAYLDRLKKLKK